MYSIFNYYYRGGGLSDSRISQLQSSLVARCMIDLGWKYEVLSSLVVGRSSEPDELGARLVFRRQHGYGVSEVQEEAGVTKDSDPNIQYFNSLSPSAQAQYTQDLGADSQAGSCVQSAMAEVIKEVPFLGGAYSDTAGEFVTSLLTDSRYQVALKGYTACMAKLGYTVDSPDSARSQLVVEFDRRLSSGEFSREGTPSAAQVDFFEREVATAVADFRCDLDNLHVVRMEIEKQLITEMVEAGRLPSAWQEDVSVSSPCDSTQTPSLPCDSVP